MMSSPVVKYIDSFSVTGLHVRTQNRDEFNEKTAKIPGLWQQFYNSEWASNSHVFGVYSNYDTDADGFYTVTVGVVSESVPAVTIQAGHYLVFQGTGPMPITVVETWQRIWDFFATHAEYRRNFISDFEAYDGSEQVMIYIGLK